MARAQLVATLTLIAALSAACEEEACHLVCDQVYDECQEDHGTECALQRNECYAACDVE